MGVMRQPRKIPPVGCNRHNGLSLFMEKAELLTIPATTTQQIVYADLSVEQLPLQIPISKKRP